MPSDAVVELEAKRQKVETPIFAVRKRVEDGFTKEELNLPVKGSEDAAGYDLCSAKKMTIPAKGKGLVGDFFLRVEERGERQVGKVGFLVKMGDEWGFLSCFDLRERV